MELVVLAFVVVGLLGLLAYARQVNLYGEKVAQRFRLPLFITIGFTVLVMLGVLAIPDLLHNLDLRGIWVIFILATWMAVFIAMTMNRHAGAVLLSVGVARPIRWRLLGLFAVVNLAPAFYFPKTDIPYLFLAMLTLVAYGLFANTLPVQITEKGFYSNGKIADWPTIRTYSWSKQINGIEFLVLHLKGRWPIFATASIPIPSKSREAVDQLLLRRGAAQHGVQPTRPACRS